MKQSQQHQNVLCCVSLMKQLLQYCVRLALFVLGWKPMHALSQQRMQQERSMMLVYLHSCWYDKWLLLTYMFAYDLLADAYVVHESSLSSHVSTDDIVGLATDIMHNNKRFILMPVMPNHVSSHCAWYELARYLMVKVNVVGVNYHPLIRTVHLAHLDDIDVQRFALDKCELTLQYKLSTIFPKTNDEKCRLRLPKRAFLQTLTCVDLHPLRLSYAPFAHPFHTDIVDMVMLTSVLLGVPVLGFLRQGMLDMFVCTCLTWISSCMYHFFYEQNQKWLMYDLAMVRVLYIYFFSRIVYMRDFNLLLSNMLSFILSVQLFYNGRGRETSLLRTFKYYWYHTAYHLSAALIGLYYGYHCLQL